MQIIVGFVAWFWDFFNGGEWIFVCGAPFNSQNTLFMRTISLVESRSNELWFLGRHVAAKCLFFSVVSTTNTSFTSSVMEWTLMISNTDTIKPNLSVWLWQDEPIHTFTGFFGSRLSATTGIIMENLENECPVRLITPWRPLSWTSSCLISLNWTLLLYHSNPPMCTFFSSFPHHGENILTTNVFMNLN